MSDPIKPPKYKNTAPPDLEVLKAWTQIMDIASKNALIVQAYGGVATLVLPSVQRQNEYGLRQQALTAAQMNETEEMEP